MLVQPILGADGQTHAVIALARRADAPAFDGAEAGLLASWAQHVAPLFSALHLEDAAARARLVAGVAGRPSIYREELLAKLSEGEPDLGVLLAPSPAWLHHIHHIATVVVLAVVAFVCLVPVREYAIGPAFVVFPDRSDLTASRSGVVDSLLVAPGDRVQRGQIVATLAADEPLAELERGRAELERVLLARLGDPGDAKLEGLVARAQLEYQRAQASVESTRLRARSDGTIRDVRVEIGRAVAPGDVVLTIAAGDVDAPVVRAVIPGRHRPALAPGQRFDLQLDGFPDAVQHLAVSGIADEALGRAETARVVGAAVADTLAVDDAAVVVEAPLDREFVADDRGWTVHAGMQGRASIAVRRRPIVFVVFPGLERLWNHV